MLVSRFLILLGSSLVAATPTPSPNKQSTEKHGDVVYTVYHHAATRSKLSFVKNSGICETTSGVNQYSGYLSVGEDANMWFWFFESRNNPRTAPLVSWFGGGPGNSAQYGMFAQHGPCEILEDGAEPTLREHSLNNHANVLYIDQPIGSGFSYGDGAKVNSTKQSSPYVWAFLQLWFEAFTEYENRDLSVFTESYGGHTGTDIVNYILDKNLDVKAGKTSGDVINVKTLSASNAWFDARIQERANLDFAFNNSYRPLINESLYVELLAKYKTEVIPSLKKCDETGTSEDCSAAQQGYLMGIDVPIWASARDRYTDWDMGHIGTSGTGPTTHHEKYLERSDVQKAIGARVNYTESGGQLGIVNSGDDAKSFLGELSRIVRDGVQVLVWAGDADYICSWVGTKRVADAVNWPRKKDFAGKALKPYKVQGVQKATFKSVKNLHFVRVFDAGHNVWWYPRDFIADNDAVSFKKGSIFHIDSSEVTSGPNPFP